MRRITLIVLHCSATRQGRRLTFRQCQQDHILHRGWKDIGYHYYVERDGRVYAGRREEVVGAHCRYHNQHSIGVCYEGGLDAEGRPADTRTPQQREALRKLVADLQQRYPRALVVGHNMLDPTKTCPCFAEL